MKGDPVHRTLLVLLLLASNGLAAACASTGAVPRPFPTPGAPSPPEGEAPPSPGSPPARPLPRMPAVDGYEVAGTALSQQGVRYRAGGASPEGFDCSGLVQYVFGQHGLAVPREAREQFRLGLRVERQHLQPGDLVFFTTVAPGASHVGIALGGDQFVHAPTDSGVVRVEHLSSDYWSRRYIGARRLN